MAIEIRMRDADPSRREQHLNSTIRIGEFIVKQTSRRAHLSEAQQRVLCRETERWHQHLDEMGMSVHDFGGNASLQDIINQLKSLRAPGKLIMGSEG